MTSALGWGGEVPQKQMKYERLHGFFSVILWLIAYKGGAGLKKLKLMRTSHVDGYLAECISAPLIKT